MLESLRFSLFITLRFSFIMKFIPKIPETLASHVLILVSRQEPQSISHSSQWKWCLLGPHSSIWQPLRQHWHWSLHTSSFPACPFSLLSFVLSPLSGILPVLHLPYSRTSFSCQPNIGISERGFLYPPQIRLCPFMIHSPGSLRFSVIALIYCD